MASQTIARLKDVVRRISHCQDAEQGSKERSASLDLLLRFQRLLICKLYVGVNGTTGVGDYSECHTYSHIPFIWFLMQGACCFLKFLSGLVKFQLFIKLLLTSQCYYMILTFL